MKIHPPIAAPRRKRASALMLMLWAVFLMAVTVMGVVEYIGYSAEEATIAAADFRALHLAESGLAVGLHPNIRRGDKALKQKVGTDSGFDVVINYEGARIPINYITDARVMEAVNKLFVYWGLNSEEATVASESLADWVDRNDEVRANGAETAYYESQGIYEIPRQQGFINVDEMLLVRGMGVVDRLKPNWRDYFSVYGEGTIDMRTAFKDVLLAMTGAAEADIDRFIQERDGPDSLPGTDDDRNISEGESYRLLGLGSAQASGLSSILNNQDTLRRITSIGWVGEKRAKIIVVARRGDNRSLTYIARMEE